MAAEATTVDAGGRELRVSNPDRVIFPMTERTGAVSKLVICRMPNTEIAHAQLIIDFARSRNPNSSSFMICQYTTNSDE